MTVDQHRRQSLITEIQKFINNNKVENQRLSKTYILSHTHAQQLDNYQIWRSLNDNMRKVPTKELEGQSGCSFQIVTLIILGTHYYEPCSQSIQIYPKHTGQKIFPAYYRTLAKYHTLYGLNKKQTNKEKENNNNNKRIIKIILANSGHYCYVGLYRYIQKEFDNCILYHVL